MTGECFVVLASNGLWSKLKTEQVLNFIDLDFNKEEALNEYLNEICDQLCELARDIGSGEDISIFILPITHICNIFGKVVQTAKNFTNEI